MNWNAKPIWWEGNTGADCYLEASANLRVQKTVGMLLRISADSDYAVYLNGRLAAFGQFASYPFRRAFDEVDVSAYLAPGENEVRILVWYAGVDCFTYSKGTPYLRFSFEQDGGTLMESGRGVMVRPAPGYLPGMERKISVQLGLTYAYDCADEGAAPYTPAAEVDLRDVEWFPRPCEKTVLRERQPVEFVQQGRFAMPDYPGLREAKPEQLMQYAALSFRYLRELTDPTGYAGDVPAFRRLREDHPRTLSLAKTGRDGLPLQVGEGLYWIVDLGQETAGFLDLDLEVPGDCDLLVGYGEHLRDGRCRTSLRNFSCMLHLKAGRNQFLNTFRRFGGRYLQFFLLAPEVTLRYCGVRPVEYPVKVKEWKSGNLLRDTIYAVCRNTLLQCMHEHYEDTPWREQSLYAMDSRNQMLCGYYAFGEYRFARASLELISYGMRPDGLLSLCYPAGLDLPIPFFSLMWVVAMREYLDYSWYKTLAEERFAVLEKLFATFEGNADGETGLIRTFNDGNRTYWNFYEWSAGMSGDKRDGEPVVEAPLNAFYVIALQNMADLCAKLGRDGAVYAARAEAIGRALFAAFWRPERGLFASFLDRGEGQYSVLTNALCLLCGAAKTLTDAEKAELLRVLACNGEGMANCVPNTLSMNSFRFDALLQEDRARFAPVILAELDRDYLYMLQGGATSFWETIKGEADFSEAGSLCHGWSALPIYYYELLCE